MARQSAKREHLVKVAQHLFYQEGFKGTGIDKVVEQAGIAKRTLYNHFASKDELIIAALERRDLEFMAMLTTYVAKFESRQDGPACFAKTLAFFDAIECWINSDSFSGCMFINASAEYPNPIDPIHKLCVSHKQNVINYIAELLPPLTTMKPELLASQMTILADGAIINAYTTDNPSAVIEAKEIASLLLNTHVQVQS